MDAAAPSVALEARPSWTPDRKRAASPSLPIKPLSDADSDYEIGPTAADGTDAIGAVAKKLRMLLPSNDESTVVAVAKPKPEPEQITEYCADAKYDGMLPCDRFSCPICDAAGEYKHKQYFVRCMKWGVSDRNAEEEADYQRKGVVAESVFGNPDLVERILLGHVGVITFVCASEFNRTCRRVCRTSLPLLRSVAIYVGGLKPAELAGFTAITADKLSLMAHKNEIPRLVVKQKRGGANHFYTEAAIDALAVIKPDFMAEAVRKRSTPAAIKHYRSAIAVKKRRRRLRDDDYDSDVPFWVSTGDDAYDKKRRRGRRTMAEKYRDREDAWRQDELRHYTDKEVAWAVIKETENKMVRLFSGRH